MLTFGGQDIVLNGNIDSISGDGVVAGWCASPDEPDVQRTVCLTIDGVDIAEIVACESRPDLAAAGLGDGAHGFTFRLATRDIPERETSVLTLRDVTTGRLVGSEVVFTWPRAAVAPPLLVGNLEAAREDGWLSGWGWYPAEPDRRVTLEILVDGILVGSTRASLFRSDLESAGIGDGRYGFSFALPWSVLSSKGEIRLSVRDAATGIGFGDPVTLRIGRLVDVEERIAGLERQVRLLNARLGEQMAAADPIREDRAARALFRTVAGFFHDLATAPDPTQPAAAALRQAVGAALDRHQPLVLAVPEQASATLLLLGDAKIDALHACLVALQQSGADRVADIVLLDRGTHGADLALLPAIVRNLRYVRVRGGSDQAGARSEIARGARGTALVVLSAQVRLAPGALAAMLAALDSAPRLALAGALVLRADGLIEEAGSVADAQGILVDIGGAEDPASPDYASLRLVDAVGDRSFAVRITALLEAGGFPAGYDDTSYATAALCFTLRGKGYDVAVEPAARAILIEDAAVTAEQARPPSAVDTRRLRDSWTALARGA